MDKRPRSDWQQCEDVDAILPPCLKKNGIIDVPALKTKDWKECICLFELLWKGEKRVIIPCMKNFMTWYYWMRNRRNLSAYRIQESFSTILASFQRDLLLGCLRSSRKEAIQSMYPDDSKSISDELFPILEDAVLIVQGHDRFIVYHDKSKWKKAKRLLRGRRKNWKDKPKTYYSQIEIESSI